ncbi:MAG: alpha/beta hydrolase [Chitinophagaceae bacterium]|nr:alpha/beta hydrolase [Oligoflexus sp.]
MLVMYPTTTPAKREKLGPFTMELAIDAPPETGPFPLILISHGSGGTPIVYRTLAEHLVRHGFIVGLPEHPLNSRSDNSESGTLHNLRNRPRHISLAIDWFYQSSPYQTHLKHSVSVIGHSMGGYTALAAAGGRPTSFAQESPEGLMEAIALTPDSRIKALVLLAPATVWFRLEDALRDVKVPVLMLIGSKDEQTPFDVHGQIIVNGLPDPSQLQYRIVDNAGHYSFLSPYTHEMTRPMFPPSQDPKGFDRRLFHEEFYAEIIRFLIDKLNT